MTFSKLIPIICVVLLASACKKSNNAVPLPTLNPNPVAGFSDTVWGVFVSEMNISYDTIYNVYAVINDDTGGYAGTNIVWNTNLLGTQNHGALFNPLTYYTPDPALYTYFLEISNYGTTSTYYPYADWQISSSTRNPALAYTATGFPQIDTFMPSVINKNTGCTIPVSGKISGADSFSLDFVYWSYSNTFFDITSMLHVCLLHQSYSAQSASITLTPDELGLLPSEYDVTVYVTAYKTEYVRGGNNKSYAFRTETRAAFAVL